MNDVPSGNFAATRWTLVARARGDDPTARLALSELCEAYYAPVVSFLRAEGRSEDAARELAHEFFARVLAGQSLSGAEAGRGRFRSYLLGAVKHFLADHRDHVQREKRGGGAVPEALDAPGTDTSPGLQVPDPCRPPDAAFDRQWAMTLLDRALSSLDEEMRVEGKADLFAVLKPWLTGDRAPLSQAEAAVQLGLSEGAVKVAVHRLRRRFRDMVVTEIAATLDPTASAEEELRHLLAALA